jgi:hypothetical protein
VLVNGWRFRHKRPYLSFHRLPGGRVRADCAIFRAGKFQWNALRDRQWNHQ